MKLNAKFMHHMPDDLHAQIKHLAKASGMTVTAFINRKLSDIIQRKRIDKIKIRLQQIAAEIETLKKK